MEVVAIGFEGGLLPAQIGIELCTLSRWSHCYARLDNGLVIDSTLEHGVSMRRRKGNHSRWHEEIRLSGKGWNFRTRTKLYDLLCDELDAPYDTDWIVSLPFGRDWQDDDAWVCSELIAAKLLLLGMYQPDDFKLRRVTPGKLYSVMQGL